MKEQDNEMQLEFPGAVLVIKDLNYNITELAMHFFASLIITSLKSMTLLQVQTNSLGRCQNGNGSKLNPDKFVISSYLSNNGSTSPSCCSKNEIGFCSNRF